MAGIREILTGVIASAHIQEMTATNLRIFAAGLLGEIFSYLSLPVIILMVGALLGAVIQHKPMFTAEKIKPKLSKISPLAGLKKIFSAQNFFEITKSILKIIIVGVLVVMLVWPEKNLLDQIMTYELGDVADLIFIMVLRIFGGVVGIMAVIAGLDFMFQKAQFVKKMKMTKQEVKDEMKQTDGDPLVKARLRQIRMDRARTRMMAAVPDADVVVTNPTHFAVALKYDGDRMQAPILVAKGADSMAQRIREIAKENRVPIVRNPLLTRALYDGVELDQEVPAEHYKAVAEIIGYVMRLKNTLPRGTARPPRR